MRQSPFLQIIVIDSQSISAGKGAVPKTPRIFSIMTIQIREHHVDKVNISEITIQRIAGDGVGAAVMKRSLLCYSSARTALKRFALALFEMVYRSSSPSGRPA